MISRGGAGARRGFTGMKGIKGVAESWSGVAAPGFLQEKPMQMDLPQDAQYAGAGRFALIPIQAL